MRRFVQIASKVFGAFATAAMVVVVLAAITWQQAALSNRASSLVVQTHEVIHALERTNALTIQTELSTQSFRISGDESRLLERDKAVAEREQLLTLIHEQTADNPAQVQRWHQLRQVVDARMAISRQVEHLRKTEGSAAATAFANAAPLQETRARTTELLQAMQTAQRQLLDEHLGTLHQADQRLLVVGSTLSVFLLTFLAAAGYLIRKQLHSIRNTSLQLAQSTESLATTLRSIGDAVISTDTQGRIVRMNPVAERLTGWSASDAVGLPIARVVRIVHESTRMEHATPVEEVLRTGKVCELGASLSLIARDGTTTPVADSAAPIRSSDGNILGAVLVLRDETTARQAQHTIQNQNTQLEMRISDRSQQLQDTQRQLLSIINNVPALIACVDAQEKYLYSNEQYRLRFAPQHQNITGHTVRSVLGEKRYDKVRELIRKALQGEPQNYDWEPFAGVWQLIHYAPFRSDDGTVQGYYVLGTDITERRNAEEARRRSEAQLARVLEGSNQGYWDWNLQTNAFEVSERWQTMLGYAPGEMQVSYENWPQLVHPEDLTKALDSIRRHMEGETDKHEVEIRVRTKEGHWRWILTSGRIVLRTDDGKPLMMSGTHTDIEERKRLELTQLDALAMFERSYEGIMVVNADGRIDKVNPSFTRITGYEAADVVGQTPQILASGRHDAHFYREFWNALHTHGFWYGEIWDKRKSGELFAALESITTVRDADGKIEHYVSQFTDITQFKAHELELDKAANYDALTQLPNRRLLSDRFSQSFLRAVRSGKSSAVCFLDLDGFKSINDRYGHKVGDQLLVGVSTHLKAILRADDTLARLGGDEFVLLLSEVNSTEECALILNRVLEAVQEPVCVGDNTLSITASIGVSLYPDDNADPDTLLRHADQAMYLAKQAGKNRYQLFDAAVDRVAQQHREFLEQVEHGLAHGEFMLYYQPKVALDSAEVIGLEALIRWQHPSQGFLNPIDFLPQIQGSTLESALGEWVIEQALCQMEQWADQGLHPVVSVNVSANHLLETDFTQRLENALGRHARIAPAQLEIEILETAAIANIGQAADILHRCNTLGVQFSLDDFGTGYSSLTYLRQLPIRTLKIDKSFVRDMLADPEDLGIVKGVIDLAHALSRMVVAEGVETREHGALLQQLGCRYAQGYGISRPMPADHVPDWMRLWKQIPWSSPEHPV